jgi:hypothetical protein
MVSLLLSLVLGPVSPAVGQLDDPRFAVREKADAQLRAGLTWGGAVRLEWQAKRLGPEGRRRAGLILDEFWLGWRPSVADMPPICPLPAFNPWLGEWFPKEPPAWVRPYLDRARSRLYDGFDRGLARRHAPQPRAAGRWPGRRGALGQGTGEVTWPTAACTPQHESAAVRSRPR